MNCTQLAAATCITLASFCASAASTVLATLPLPEDPSGFAYDPVARRAYIANYKASTISVYDVDTKAAIGDIVVPKKPDHLWVDTAGHKLYTYNFVGKAFTIIDTRTKAILGEVPYFGDPWAIRFDARRAELYIVSQNPNSLSIVNFKQKAVVATIPLAGKPYVPGVSIRFAKIYVPLYDTGTVAVIDLSTRTLVKSVKVGRRPVWAEPDEKSGIVFVGNIQDNTVSGIDAKNDTVKFDLSNINITNNGSFLFPEVSSVYQKVFIPDVAKNVVHIVDSSLDYPPVTQVAVTNPSQVQMNPVFGEAYVTNSPGDTITILDVRFRKVSSTLKVGTNPYVQFGDGDRLLLVSDNGAAADTLVMATPEGLLADTGIATEFYHKGFDHYFHTASAPETRVMRDGIFGDAWDEAYQYWRVWSTPGPGRFPVCRFFSTTFGEKSSHFYTPVASECAALKAGNVWQYEETSYYLALPDAAGACPPIYEELYRLYNNGMGGAPNHRLTLSRSVRDAMIAQGWTAEGSGPQTVFACTPLLNGARLTPA